MAKIIAIVNQKGGVGKTTTTVNLTAALAALGKRVLLCDFDPQANATSGMGVDKNTASPNVYDVLINGADPRRGVVTTHYGDVLPSNKALAGAGVEMIALPDREHLLRKALEVLSPGYDFIFVDCPPSLELLTVNALCAADSLLVPVQCEYYALEGLSDLLSTVRLVKRSLNPRLVLEGVRSPCLTAAPISLFKWRRKLNVTFPVRSTPRSSPAMCAYPRPPAMGSPSPPTTPTPGGRRPTGCWRRRSQPSTPRRPLSELSPAFSPGP